jgi:RNA polymerase sigma-70 factor (ECF subfamily)
LTKPDDFTKAYCRLFPPVHAKCRRLLGRSTAAEDVAQETFLRFWASPLKAAQDVRLVTAWLYRTSTRLAIDALREHGRAKRDPHDLVIEDLPGAVDPAACAAARAAIEVLARSVSDDELAAAVLCRVDGLAQLEAAEVLGITERTVRRMLRRFDEKVASLRKECSS